MSYYRTLVIVGLFLLIWSAIAIAAFPPFINYQGRLTDSTGEPVPDGIYSVVFTIYDAPTGGIIKWISDPISIEVKNGLFNAVIGEIPTPVFDPANDRFLGITVGTDPEMTPRIWLTTVPYAYYAGSAYSSATCQAWQINSNDIYHLDGNVGIGVNNPTVALTIGQNISGYNGTYMSISDPGAYGISGIILGQDADHNGKLLWTQGGNSFWITQRVGIDDYIAMQVQNGNVGIGGVSTPQFALQVQSDGEGDGLRVDSHLENQLFRVRENSDASCEIQVSDNAGAVKAMVRGNGDSYLLGGDLGIGTSNPNYTLDVRGTIGNNTTLYHSDRRWKKDIAPIQNALEAVRQLRGVSYQWRQDEYPAMNFPEGDQIGLIAQEVEAVVPEVVFTNDEGYKSIEYAKLLALMTEAIKSQQEQIEILNARVAELEKVK